MPPGRPQKIADVLSEMLARRGYSRQQGSTDLSRAWQQAAGAVLADHSRAGGVRRGKLEVLVSHSAIVQELTFQKANILARLRESAPDEQITDLRFRVGAID